MKKLFFLILVLSNIYSYSIAQTYTATLAIDDVDISGINPGEKFVIPVRFKEKSGGLIAGFQLFVEFDHNIFQWNATFDNPVSGVQNFHAKMPADSWMFNDNGNQIVALWDDRTFLGIDLGTNEVLIEYVFIYKGGLERGSSSLLIWGDRNEVIEGKLVRGKTEVYDEGLKNFTLTMINGAIKN